ncbi:hypothetical protein [Streptomyces europaeiscabiei]|uniref:hypothetical protein n=1 Tax=Streptomyces europaeiscabiei TaxID=146819 RepID=UPI0018FE817E|nr:hypothetical protein [Streptomyces europaeiscabiei]
MDDAVGGGQGPADLLQALQCGEEAEPVGGVGLLLGVGVDFVVDAGGVGEAVEEAAVVLADHVGDAVRAQGVEVGDLVGVVGLGVQADLVRGVVQGAEAHGGVDPEVLAHGAGEEERGGLHQRGPQVRGAVDLGADAEDHVLRFGGLDPRADQVDRAGHAVGGDVVGRDE